MFENREQYSSELGINATSQMEEETLRIRELEDDVNELRTTVDKNETEFATLQKQHEELKDLATERLTEAKASQMALERMQVRFHDVASFGNGSVSGRKGDTEESDFLSGRAVPGVPGYHPR